MDNSLVFTWSFLHVFGFTQRALGARDLGAPVLLQQVLLLLPPPLLRILGHRVGLEGGGLGVQLEGAVSVGAFVSLWLPLLRRRWRRLGVRGFVGGAVLLGGVHVPVMAGGRVPPLAAPLAHPLLPVHVLGRQGPPAPAPPPPPLPVPRQRTVLTPTLSGAGGEVAGVREVDGGGLVPAFRCVGNVHTLAVGLRGGRDRAAVVRLRGGLLNVLLQVGPELAAVVLSQEACVGVFLRGGARLIRAALRGLASPVDPLGLEGRVHGALLG